MLVSLLGAIGAVESDEDRREEAVRSTVAFLIEHFE